jgi:hypothetical protein
MDDRNQRAQPRSERFRDFRQLGARIGDFDHRAYLLPSDRFASTAADLVVMSALELARKDAGLTVTRGPDRMGIIASSSRAPGWWRGTSPRSIDLAILRCTRHSGTANALAHHGGIKNGHDHHQRLRRRVSGDRACGSWRVRRPT